MGILFGFTAILKNFLKKENQNFFVGWGIVSDSAVLIL